MEREQDSAGVYFLSREAFEACAPEMKDGGATCEICGQEEADPTEQAADEAEAAQE
jgi:hypothetical protein